MILKTLVLAAILHMSPMNQYPKWAYKIETPDQRLQRLDSIAQDIAAVVLDPEEEPIFDGPKGRIQTAVFLASDLAVSVTGEDLNVSAGMVMY